MLVRIESPRRSRDYLGFTALAATASALILLRAPYGLPHDDVPDRLDDQRLLSKPSLPIPWLSLSEQACGQGDGKDRSEPSRPATTPQTWVVSDDYPAMALRNGWQGRMRFRLAVSERGDPIRCEVTTSSGRGVLDTAACGALMERARFRPALDRTACPIPSFYSNSVLWQIPAK